MNLIIKGRNHSNKTNYANIICCIDSKTAEIWRRWDSDVSFHFFLFIYLSIYLFLFIFLFICLFYILTANPSLLPPTVPNLYFPFTRTAWRPPWVFSPPTHQVSTGLEATPRPIRAARLRKLIPERDRQKLQGKDLLSLPGTTWRPSYLSAIHAGRRVTGRWSWSPCILPWWWFSLYEPPRV